MSSALGPLLLRSCAAADNVADDDADVAAEGAVSADALTTDAASACDPDDAPPHRRSTRGRRSLPCSRQTRSRARPAACFP